MTEALNSLLSKCQLCDPPFEKLIDTTLSSLETSRFHFAIHLQETLDSNRDNLAPLQRLCILCAVFAIGGGLKPQSPSSVSANINSDDVNDMAGSDNVFSSFLRRYQDDAATIMSEFNNEREVQLKLPLLQVSGKESTNDYNFTSIPMSIPEFYRPLPEIICMPNDRPSLGLHFIQTSYPSLRYQWLQPDDPKPSIDELLEKAFNAPLELEEEQVVLLHCKKTGIGASTAVKSSTRRKNGSSTSPLVTPENLPNLVEHNPTLAIELLMKLPNKTSESSLYHSALVNMDITLHTMEVVYKLATNSKLDTEYLHVFVLGLFERCTKAEGVGGHDRKMVRLVSVFLQNLIQNGIVNVEDYVEVQAFCIENSRIREANTLFKLLKEKSIRK